MMQTIRTLLVYFMRPLAQLASLGIMVGAFAAILFSSVNRFDASDPAPPLKHDTGVQIKATPVKVALVITSMPTFDIADNTFTADLIVSFSFDEGKIPFTSIDKFSFDRAKIDEKSEPFVRKKDGTTFVRYRVRVTFSSSLDHRQFPLNDHTLYLILKNEFIEAEKLSFVATKESFFIEPEVETDVWTIVDRSVKTGYFEDVLAENSSESLKYPVVIFSMDLAKQGLRKVFLIMLPMLILFILASVSFSLDPKELGSSILGLSTGTLTGLIAYRFVIERVTPNVGYFTFTDHVFNLFLVAIFVIYLVNLYAIKRGEDDTSLIALKGATLLCLQLFLLGSFLVLSW